MTYIIKHFIEESGQLIVKFDGAVSTFSIDVPLTQEGLYITGEELDAYIKGFEPTDYINRGKKIAAGVANSAALKALETEPLPTQAQQAQQTQLVEDAKAAEIEKHVKTALIKLGVISV
jgi:hypothetical protein